MKRIDTSSAVGNKFVDGNVSQGIKGTQVSAEFLNNVQEEICNVVEGFGKSLDGSNNHQMLDSIKERTSTTIVFKTSDLNAVTNTERKINFATLQVGASKFMDVTLEFVLNNSTLFAEGEMLTITMKVGGTLKATKTILPNGTSHFSTRWTYKNTGNDVANIEFFYITSGTTELNIRRIEEVGTIGF